MAQVARVVTSARSLAQPHKLLAAVKIFARRKMTVAGVEPKQSGQREQIRTVTE
ncbi:MAG: hypothetical protein JOY71_24835 [Acetobacteraceae bacterium]|nr:hypothetical protein [Acetobacteraceae bacterium]